MTVYFTTIISFETDLTINTVPLYQKILRNIALPGEENLVIDMRRSSNLTTAGAAFLVLLRNRLKRKIILVNLSRKAKAILRMLRLDNSLFEIVEDNQIIPTLCLKP